MQKIVRDFFDSIANIRVDVVYSDGGIDPTYFRPNLTAEQASYAQKLVESSTGECSFSEFVEYSEQYFDENWTDNKGAVLYDEVEEALEIQQDYDMIGMGDEYNYLLAELGEEAMGYAQEYPRECGLMGKMTKTSQEKILDLFVEFVSENKSQYFDE